MDTESKLRHSLPPMHHQHGVLDETSLLPTEVMIPIFKHVAGVDYWTEATADTATYPRRLHVLAQVCKRWADIVKGTPELWETVDGRMEEDDLEMALALSRSRPIIVHDSRGRRMREVLMRELGRWRVATITTESRSVIRDLAQVNGARLLERFELDFTKPTKLGSTVLKLDGPFSPALRHLQLCQVALHDWSSSLLGGLRSLTLLRIDKSGPSLQQMIDILIECPDLQELRLEDIVFGGDPLTLTGRRRVVLPRLRSLTVETLHSAITDELLSTLETPQCTRCWVTVDSDLMTQQLPSPSIRTSIISSLAPMFHSCLQPYLTSGEAFAEFHLGFDPELSLWANCDYNPGDLAFLLALSDISAESALKAWTDAFGLDHYTHTWISIRLIFRRAIQLDDIILKEALWRLPGIQSLDFQAAGTGINDVLNQLSSPKVYYGGRCVWLCPKLDDICLSAAEDLDVWVLVRMAKAWSEATALGEGPVPFKRFEIRTKATAKDEAALQVLTNTLGSAFSWDVIR